MTNYLHRFYRQLLLVVCFSLLTWQSQAQLTGTDAYYVYSNIYSGSEPWYTTTNSESMDAVFGSGEWTVEYFETIDVDAVFSSATCFVWLEGGDMMASELEDFLDDNIAIIEDWVEMGGHLFLNAAPNEGDGMSFGFDGVNLDYSWYTSTAIPADDSHPIFEGPFTPVGDSWSGSSFGHAAISGGDTYAVLKDMADESKIVLAEKSWGLGIAMFGGMTPTYFHSPATEATNLRNNILSYLAICILSDIDAGIQSITAPSTGCSLGSEEVTVKVKNYGYDALSDIPVYYSVDGGAVVSETVSGTLDPGSSTLYTFSALADLSSTGDHVIETWTAYAGDTIFSNDTNAVVVSNIPIITTFPYIEDFEDGASGWMSGGSSSTWELGYPDGPVISGAPPTTPESENSWATSLYDYYDMSENSYVVSPCFDFSTLEQPYVEFDIWWATPDFYDGARLEYSLDGGASWQALGDIGTGDNWYTDGGCYAFGYDPVTFTYFPAWEGSSGGWKTAKHDLDILAGEPQVQLRIHFKTSTFFSGYDGIAFDNFFVGDPYPDDVGVIALVSPASGPALGAAEAVTVTIENFGLNSESGFPVSYQMDGGTVVTETFTGTIDPGTTADYTFSTTEDLSADGDYTFVAWTELGTDGDLTNDTLTKVISNLLPITGTDAYYIYSNVYGGSEPWYTTTNSEAMDAVFGDGSWTQDFFETVDAAAVFSAATCFVWLEGSDAMADELENFLNTNAETIQNWVASGGHLFLNSAPNEGDGMDFLFDGVTLDYSWFTGTAGIGDPDHPIFDGPYTPVGETWTGSSFGHASVSGGDSYAVIIDEYTPERVVLAEKSWGGGVVMFGGMTPTYFHSPATEATNLRWNIISYLGVCTLADTDVGVQSITAPATGCGLGEESVTVKVRNYGFEPQSDIPVNYSVDGGTTVTETIADEIAPGETFLYTFAGLADVSATGEHTIIAWTSLDGDSILSNDTSDITFTNIPIISTYPYFEDFEAGDGGWTQGGTNSTWELGSPADDIIDSPPPATPSSVNSWMTNLDGDYNNGEKSYVLGPCFDFSALVLPYVQLDIWWEAENYYDGAELQYSLDGGASWTVVGTIGSGDNWYTNYGVGFGYDPSWPSGYPEGWVGSGGSWKTAYHDISFLAGEPQVQFRVFFGSDGSVNWYNGVAFDNFKIADPFPDDIGVVALVDPPLASASYSSAETVTVAIKNFGTEDQTGFTVKYVADGGTTYSGTYAGTLVAGATDNFTFASTADLSDFGSHSICAWTELAGDADMSNDSTCFDLYHMAPVTGGDAYLVYSNSTGYEPFYTTEYSDAMDDVFGDDAWMLEYYEEMDPFEVFNPATCFIYMQGGADHSSEMQAFLDENQNLVEAWVEAGGNLIMNACSYEITSGDTLHLGFDNTGIYFYWYTYEASAVDELHPIFTGPFTPAGTDYSGYYISYGYLTGGDFTPLLEDSYTPGNYIIGEQDWGAGHVLFAALYYPDYWTTSEEGKNMHRNMLDYMKECATGADLRVSNILSPEGGCGLTATETVTVEIENLSGVAVTGVPVSFSVDGGGTPVTETVAATIDAFATVEYTFTATADLSVAGDHNVAAWTEYAGDLDPTNDLDSVVVASLATPVLELGPNSTECDEVTLDAGNPGAVYSWSTGATTQEIVVTSSGTYSVTVTDPVSGCTASDNITLTINYSPSASFTYTAAGLLVTFTNTSTEGATYSWNFGDGATSTETNPSHEYTAEGTYTVTVTVSNGCGSDFYSAVISVSTGIQELALANATQIYPNPTTGKAVVDFNLDGFYNISMQLVNSLGQVVWEANPGSIMHSVMEIDLSTLADGMYSMQITADTYTFTKPLVIAKD